MKKKMMVYLIMIMCFSTLVLADTKYIYMDNVNVSLEERQVGGVHTVVVFSKPYFDYCGFYWFGGMVWLNVKDDCDVGHVFWHELGHHYWFTGISLKDQVNYCRDKGLVYGGECWEFFANDYMFRND